MSQLDQIRNALESATRLTSSEALARFGCSRLAARIGELKGIINIRDQFIEVHNRYGETVRVKEYWV